MKIKNKYNSLSKTKKVAVMVGSVGLIAIITCSAIFIFAPSTNRINSVDVAETSSEEVVSNALVVPSEEMVSSEPKVSSEVSSEPVETSTPTVSSKASTNTSSKKTTTTTTTTSTAPATVTSTPETVTSSEFSWSDITVLGTCPYCGKKLISPEDYVRIYHEFGCNPHDLGYCNGDCNITVQ